MVGWLQDEVALVTGGASGIGRAVVERYLREGAAGVVVLDRDGEGLAALEADHPGRVVGLAGDVREFACHARAVEIACTRFGRLDVLVANAGVFDFHRPLAGYAPDQLAATLDELMAINVRGYLFAAMASRQALVDGGGSMIFTASVASFHAGGGGIVYTAAKHAILGIIRELARELAPQVRVNGVGPGGTLTRLRGTDALGHAHRSLADNRAAAAARIGAAVPLGFAQAPEDHTGLYVLLASRGNARAITGEVFMSDGGIGVRPL
jgi:cis-3,4-dihydrophenanthrene-3,4-diol dehydrogenase